MIGRTNVGTAMDAAMGTATATCIRVLIADDHAIVRKGIRALLATERDIDVVGEARAERGRLGDGPPAVLPAHAENPRAPPREVHDRPVDLISLRREGHAAVDRLVGGHQAGSEDPGDRSRWLLADVVTLEEREHRWSLVRAPTDEEIHDLLVPTLAGQMESGDRKSVV